MLRFDCKTGSREHLLTQVDSFHEHGVMVLEGAFSREFIDALAAHYFTFYHPRICSSDFPYRIAPLGPGRTHVTLELHKHWHDPRFYANEWLYPFLSKVLGSEFTMPTFAAAVSEPGAKAQYIHRDQPWLFPDPTLESQLPASSVTVSVPLVDVDELIGSTEFQPGSHHPRSRADMALRRPVAGIDFVPAFARRGDCILWDSRSIHRGMPNRSQHTRPIVLMYYQRPWFFNHVNFDPGVILPFTEAAWRRIPNKYRHIFTMVRRLFPRPVYAGESGSPCPCGSGLGFEHCHGEESA